MSTQPPATPEQWIAHGAEDADKRRAAEPTKRLTIDLPESLHRRVKSGCAQRGAKMADVIRTLLEQEFPG